MIWNGIICILPCQGMAPWVTWKGWNTLSFWWLPQLLFHSTWKQPETTEYTGQHSVRGTWLSVVTHCRLDYPTPKFCWQTQEAQNLKRWTEHITGCGKIEVKHTRMLRKDKQLKYLIYHLPILGRIQRFYKRSSCIRWLFFLRTVE